MLYGTVTGRKLLMSIDLDFMISGNFLYSNDRFKRCINGSPHFMSAFLNLTVVRHQATAPTLNSLPHIYDICVISVFCDALISRKIATFIGKKKTDRKRNNGYFGSRPRDAKEYKKTGTVLLKRCCCRIVNNLVVSLPYPLRIFLCTPLFKRESERRNCSSKSFL